MRSWNELGLQIVDAAVAGAVSAAQWERIDLQTRRPGQDAEELLLGKAAELAMSPIGRDQLLSAAVERVFQGFHQDHPLIDVDCCSAERSVIMDRVFALGPHRGSGTESVVLAIEERHAGHLSQDARYDPLAECLRRDAVLQEELWNHPGIPASDAVRLTMLCSIPKLYQRADELSLSSRGWWRHIMRRLRSIVKRDAP